MVFIRIAWIALPNTLTGHSRHHWTRPMLAKGTTALYAG
jgi:hypothetical protein